jgi:hypothetical protein
MSVSLLLASAALNGRKSMHISFAKAQDLFDELHDRGDIPKPLLAQAWGERKFIHNGILVRFDLPHKAARIYPKRLKVRTDD